ncbi:MAG: TonB-dependent receptor [Chitinophagales bacterium]
MHSYLCSAPTHFMKQYIVIFFIAFQSLLAAQNGIISGNVVNSVSNEPLPFSTILITGTSIGTQSDFDGKFVLDGLNPGIYNIEVSSVGFKKKSILDLQVSNVKPLELVIALEEDVKLLDAVVINAAPSDRTEESPLSLRTIGVNEIKRSPGGNSDISIVIQSLPGVTSASSFRNDILIRGGAPNENRFYLDGVEVPNINHFATQGSSGGPVGLINVDFIKEVDFYSGAFPANRGNALSSVFEFQQRDGRSDKWGGSFTLGASDIGILVEGPVNEKSTLLFSARRSYLQVLFGVLGLPFLPTYNDFQFKYKIKLNQKNELTFIGLGAIDDFELNTADDTSALQQYILGTIPVQTQWNYTIGAVYKHYRENGYNTLVASRNMLNNRAYKYLNNDESDASNLIFDYTSQEIENKFRYEETMRFGDMKISGGAQYEYARYFNSTYQVLPTDTGYDFINYTSNLDLHKWGLFGSISNSFFDNLVTVAFGLRADANSYDKEMQNLLNQLSPRLSFSYQFLPKWSFNANTGIYYQLPPYTTLGYRDAENNLVNQENGLTYIRANHIVAGFEYRPRTSTRFTLEGFYKKYSNYLFSIRDSISLANLGADFGVIGDEPVSSTSDGRAFGFEFLAQQRLTKNFYGILAYTFVYSQFQDKNNVYVPSSWDNRHIISLTGGYEFKKDWELGLKWRFNTGLPYTPYDVPFSSLTYVWDINKSGVPDYDQLNTVRLGITQEVDIRIDKKWYLNKININLYADVQNVLNFKTDLQPILDAQKDADGNLIINPDDPSRYQMYYIQNPSGTLLPTLGIIIEI